MRVLITGANGQLGQELEKLCVALDDEVTPCGHADLDITDRDQTLQLVHAYRPEVIVHGGAWTNVDGCESDPHRAYLVNAMGTRNVAEAARAAHARVVYVSSDYVFDGRGGGVGGGRPYTEWDTPNPQSHYGRSKLGGEVEVFGLLGPDATVVRTSWVVGAFGSNFLKTMLRLADGDATPNVVDDQLGCPTFTPDLARVVRALAVRRLPGVFHVSNTEPVTWCGFAKAIFAAAGHDPGRVLPTTTAAYVAGRTTVTAPRPAFSVLDQSALHAVGIEMESWRASLGATVALLR